MKYGGDVTRLRDIVRATLVIQVLDVGTFYDALGAPSGAAKDFLDTFGREALAAVPSLRGARPPKRS